MGGSERVTTGNYESVSCLANRNYVLRSWKRAEKRDWVVLRFLLFTGVKGSEDVLDIGCMRERKTEKRLKDFGNCFVLRGES